METLDKNINALIEKMKRIRQLAERGGTEGEAAAAAAMLQKLLAQHKIDAALLNEDKERIVIVEGNFRQDGNRSINWRQLLTNNLARLNACRMILYKEDKLAYCLIGHEADVVGLQSLLEYLETVVKRLSLQTWNEWPDKNLPGLKRESFLAKVCEGIVLRIIQRLMDQVQETEREQDAKLRKAAAGSNLPVVVSRDLMSKRDMLVERHINDALGASKNQKPIKRSSPDSEALQLGYALGGSVALNKQVGAKAPKEELTHGKA